MEMIFCIGIGILIEITFQIITYTYTKHKIVITSWNHKNLKYALLCTRYGIVHTYITTLDYNVI